MSIEDEANKLLDEAFDEIQLFIDGYKKHLNYTSLKDNNILTNDFYERILKDIDNMDDGIKFYTTNTKLYAYLMFIKTNILKNNDR